MFDLDEAVMNKWSPILENKEVESINDPYKKNVVAKLLENQEKSLQSQRSAENTNILSEAAPTNNISGGNIGSYDPILISLVRRAMPKLIAFDVAGVQPMNGPTGLIFAMRAKYGSQGGDEAFFNEADSSFSGSGSQGADPTGLEGVTDVDADNDITDEASVTSDFCTILPTATAEDLGRGTASMKCLSQSINLLLLLVQEL